LQRFAVADEAAGSGMMVFDRSRDGRGDVSEVWPRFAERGEVIVSAEAFIRPGGDQLEYVVDRFGREFRAVWRSPRIAQFVKLDSGKQRLTTPGRLVHRVDRFRRVM